MSKLEPTADMREWAGAMRQQWVALLDAGFTPGEAALILGSWLANIRFDQGNTDA